MKLKRSVRIAIPVFVLVTAAQCVAGSASSRDQSKEFSFATRILPLLTKAGCNAGACHGAATGQHGFKLSLLGYDPEQDYETITRELSGRRIDLGAPEQSLLLRKPTRQLDHEGGRRIPRDSQAYRTILDWIAGGAPYGSHDLRVTGIEVSPAAAVLQKPGQSRPLKVAARLSDGTDEDVTSLALYTSNDDGVADVDRDGVVTVKNRGLTAIMIRYSGQVAAARVGAPYQEAAFAGSFPAQNFIDERVLEELKLLRIPPSPLCDDVSFLRRVHLDVAGRLPTPAEVKAFVAEPAAAAKRERVIDRLLASPEFVDFWTLKLADLLLINSKKLGEDGARAYYGWLRQQVANNARFDRVARELLTAHGDASRDGPVNFYRLTTDPRDMGEFVSRALLGTRVACARCHNHPFDRWTQDDYYHFAAFFARTGFENQRLIQRPFGEVQHPRTGKDVMPQPLGSTRASAGDGVGDRRAALADWLTGPENPLFARAVVNRVWKELLGRGIVEPVDDLRPTNPPSNPALLDALAADFVRQGYDLRKLIRTIVSSGTYQLSSRANEINRQDDRFFSHAYLKPLAAQVLADTIAQATGVPDEYEGYAADTRAVALVDPQVPSYTLDVFGRCPRATACENSAQYGGGLSQALHLVNGPAVNAKTEKAVSSLLPLTNPAAIEELFLRTLSRLPNASERTHWEKVLSAATSRRDMLEDLFWALLNSREFAFNH